MFDPQCMMPACQAKALYSSIITPKIAVIYITDEALLVITASSKVMFVFLCTVHPQINWCIPKLKLKLKVPCHTYWTKQTCMDLSHSLSQNLLQGV